MNLVSIIRFHVFQQKITLARIQTASKTSFRAMGIAMWEGDESQDSRDSWEFLSSEQSEENQWMENNYEKEFPVGPVA